MSGAAAARTDDGAALPSAVDLLERAVAYTRPSLQLVTVGVLRRRTPCTQWDLQDLLHHMVDSLDALQQAAEMGEVTVERTSPETGDDLVSALRTRACSLLGAWTNSPAHSVSVAGRPVPAPIVAVTGALEIAVHGWDVAQACGSDRPLPDALAGALLVRLPMLVRPDDRPTRFAAAVDAGMRAGPGGLLLAQLGRRPGH